MAKSVHLIFGDEYLASMKAKEFVEKLVPEAERAFGLEIIDGNAGLVADAVKVIHSCIEAVQTFGFMGSQKVIWLRNATFLTDNVVGRSKNVKEPVNELAAIIKGGLPDGNVLVVSSPKVDKRYAFYKACKAVGELNEFSIPDQPWKAKQQIAEIAKAEFRKKGLKVQENALQPFLDKVGLDTRQIVNEIEKLAVYVGDAKDVTRKDVAAVTCASREVPAWDLADAFGNKNLIKTLNVLRQLIFQKQSPMGLIMGLQGRIRELMIYREALDNRWLMTKPGYGGRGELAEWTDVPHQVEEMFSEEFEKDPRKIHPFRAGVLSAQAKRFSADELSRCHKAVMDAHVKLVSTGIPQPMVLELLIIDMLSQR